MQPDADRLIAGHSCVLEPNGETLCLVSADSRVPITGVVHRPVSPRAGTGPTVSRFSAHTATELVTVGPIFT